MDPVTPHQTQAVLRHLVMSTMPVGAPLVLRQQAEAIQRRGCWCLFKGRRELCLACTVEAVRTEGGG